MSTPQKAAILHIMFAAVATAFFMLGALGSQMTFTEFTFTSVMYLYKETGGGMTMYYKRANFDCPVAFDVVTAALSFGVIGAALCLCAVGLSVGLLVSPSSVSLKAILNAVRFLIQIASAVLFCLVIAFYTASFCGSASFSQTWDVDYGFIFAILTVPLSICWIVAEHVVVRISSNSLGGEATPLNS